MTDEYIPELPPRAERVAELHRYVRARDIEWLRAQHAAGALGWLEEQIGPKDCQALGSAIEAGDIGLVERRLATMDEPDTAINEPPVAVPVAARVGDPLGSDLGDPTLIVSRHGAVLPAAAVRRERNTLVVAAVVLALVAAGVVAYLLLRNRDETAADTSIAADTIVADTVAAIIVVPPEPIASTVPPTSGAVTTALVPTTTLAGAATTVGATAPPLTAAVALPVVTVPVVAAPLVDVVSTASRSATFGPYLAMVDAAGLTNELRARKNVTIFAPTESAFMALPTEVQVALRSPSNRDALARIVRYSLLTQSRSASQLTPGNYATAEGSSVNVQLLDGTVRINDATITGKDVKVINGVVHAIDRLLVPATLDLMSLIPKSATPPTTAPVRATTVAPTTPATPVPTSAQVTTVAPVTPTTVAASSPATNAPTTAAPTTVVPATRAPTTTTV